MRPTLPMQSWNDIIFEKKNKDYGAYRIRKLYATHLAAGLLSSIAMSLVLLLKSTIVVNTKNNKIDSIQVSPYRHLPPAPLVQESSGHKRSIRSPKKEFRAKRVEDIPPEAVRREVKQPDVDKLSSEIIDDPGEVSNGTGGTETGNEGTENANGQGQSMDGEISSGGENEVHDVFYIKAITTQYFEINFDDEIDKALFSSYPSQKYVGTDRESVRKLVQSGYLDYNHRLSMVMVNENHAINIAKIDSIKDNKVFLENGQGFRIGSRYQEVFYERLKVFAQSYSNPRLSDLLAATNRKSHKRSKGFHRRAVTARQSSSELLPKRDEIRYAANLTSTPALFTTSLTGATDNVYQDFGKRLMFERHSLDAKKIQDAIKLRKQLEEIRREELQALKFSRPYGTPDHTVKVDQSMQSFSSIGQILGSGRVPGIIVSGNDIYIRSAGTYTVDDPEHPGEQVKRAGLSLGGGEDPLYLLDGMISSKETVLALPVSSIVAIDILKSADNTALYGSKGAYGVIAVFTKK